MRKRFPAASFRRSVIRVAAAFTAVPGCAIDHDANGKDIDEVNPPTCEEGSTAAGCMPSAECTDTPPESGASCPEEGAVCYYDSCTTPDNVDEARCTDGRWSLGQSSCNPPEPPECPHAEPEEGAACSLAADMWCSYGDCGGTPRIDATCIDGAWSVIENSCNPPWPEGCPEQPPVTGDACYGLTLGAVCAYGDCHGEPTITATCGAEGFEVSEIECNPTPLLCPDDAPQADTMCPEPGVLCTYDLHDPLCENGGASTLRAECFDGLWALTQICTVQGNG
jgi:hypothetical protein